MNSTFKQISLILAVTALFSGCASNQNSSHSTVNTPTQANTSNTPINASSYSGTNYATRPDVQAFVQMMSDKYGYSKEELLKTFAATERMDTVLNQLEKDKPNPNYKKNWEAYRTRYIEPIRIRAGVNFWNKNASTLSRAAKQYGVPEYILVGIIGVETIYGQYMGNTNTFDVLTTVAFDYPRRSNEYKKFLEEYIVLAKTNKMPLRSVKGSYAGAVGIPQFMPDSWHDYGVDFDGDGKVDLRNSTADAIGSVANFLSKKGGWIPGQDVVYSVRFDNKNPKISELLSKPIEPSLTIKQIKDFGVSSPENIRPDVKLSLIDLPNGNKATQYVLGSQNFYAITRYNKSYMYAMSVYDLGLEVAKARARK